MPYTTTDRPLRVFLCHSSADKPAVRELYQKLRAEPWIQPWLDEEELYPGQDWNLEIEKAVESADAIIVCLSKNSISKEGYVQREIRIALDYADYKPEGTLFIIPVRLEECEPPRRLRMWQYADYFMGERERAFQRLLVSLRRRAESLAVKFGKLSSAKKEKPVATKKPVSKTKIDKQETHPNFMGKQSAAEVPTSEQVILMQHETSEQATNEALTLLKEIVENLSIVPEDEEINIVSDKFTLSNGMEFMRVPAGKFLMGSTKENKFANDDESPQHVVDIPYDYWMARFVVTNELYSAYAKAKEIVHPVSDWEKKKEHPVVNIRWADAVEYCQWLNNFFKFQLPPDMVLRLPTEAEWEKAARGTKECEYPWGNVFDRNKGNTSESRRDSTTPTGSYSPNGDSPYGCADIAGNVWEWTHSLKKAYPYRADDGREAGMPSVSRVLRGGSFVNDQMYARCAYRSSVSIFIIHSFGFRVCLAPPLPR